MNYYNETRTHQSLDKDAPYRARFREQGVFFAFQSWMACITNIVGFDLRQAQPLQNATKAEETGYLADANEADQHRASRARPGRDTLDFGVLR
jgi:hypothetical protein